MTSLGKNKEAILSALLPKQNVSQKDKPKYVYNLNREQNAFQTILISLLNIEIKKG